MKREWINYLLVFIWPFLFLFRYVIGTEMVTLDVMHFYFPKVYLLEALSNFRIPLWSPTESAGFPFYSSPYNQVFYPMNIIMVIYYKIMGGFSWVDYQRFSILGISIFSCCLYAWLRHLKVSARAALISTLIMAISFKIAGTLNRIPATHSIAWMMMMLLGMTQMLKDSTRIKGWILVFVGTLMLLTLLYPYYIYYCLFIIPFFGVMYLIKNTRVLLTGIEQLNIPKYIMATGSAFLLPLLMCIPYLLSFRSLNGLVNSRTDKDWIYIKDASCTITDTLGSLFFPPYSDMRGWYYMGFIVILILVFYIVNHFYRLSKQKLDSKLTIILLAYFLILTMMTYGESFLFYGMVKYFPGFSNFRTWGRLNVLLVPIFALLFAKAYQYFEQIITNKEIRVDDYSKRIWPFMGIFTGAYLLILAIQMYLLNFENYAYIWKIRLMALLPNFNNNSYIYIGLAYFLLISALLIGTHYWTKNKELSQPLKGLAMGLVGLFTLLSAYDIGYVSIYTRSHPGISYYDKFNIERHQTDLDKIMMESFKQPRISDVNLQHQLMNIYRTDSTKSGNSKAGFSVRAGISWWDKNYTEFAKANSEVITRKTWRWVLKFNKDLAQFMGLNDGKKIYFSKKIDYSKKQLKQYLNDVEDHEYLGNFDYEPINYNGDRLDIVVASHKTGYLSFIDNWNPHWKVYVNQQPAKLEKLFGAFKSVKIGDGINYVSFVYEPPFFSFLKGKAKKDFPPKSLPKKFKNRPINSTRNIVQDLTNKEVSDINALSRTLIANNPVSWNEGYGVKTDKDQITCTLNNSDWGSAGISSKNVLPAQVNGCVQTVIAETDKNRIFGLARNDKDLHYNKINFAFHITGKSTLNIFENGKKKKSDIPYKEGDILRIERIDNKIYYRKNDAILFRSQNKGSGQFLVDVSFLNEGGTLFDTKVTFEAIQ